MSTSARRAESRSVAIIEDLATRRDGAKRKIIGPIELAALINFTTSGPLNLFFLLSRGEGHGDIVLEVWW